MTADRLLLWLSARREGSWEQFKGAVEELGASVPPRGSGEDDISPQYGLPLYQRLRLNLQRLAHVEFFARGCQNGWRVGPPVLALNQRGGRWEGIFCGARSPKLLDRLHSLHEVAEGPASD